VPLHLTDWGVDFAVWCSYKYLNRYWQYLAVPSKYPLVPGSIFQYTWYYLAVPGSTCTYKYHNSGAGGIAGAFVHSRHHDNMPTHLQGWWSNAQHTRWERRETVMMTMMMMMNGER
jgi:kynureninase